MPQPPNASLIRPGHHSERIRLSEPVSFRDCYPLLGCTMIELVPVNYYGEDTYMLVDEEGLFDQPTVPNLVASMIADRPIVGNAIVLDTADMLEE